MALTTAERNRRKRERKKREREEQRKFEKEVAQKEKEEPKAEEDELEIEYVAEVVLPEQNSGAASNDNAQEYMESILKRFQERSSVAVISDDEKRPSSDAHVVADADSDDELEPNTVSKRKQRELSRPSVADLKRRVKRADLVEAHDVTAADPDFLICLKGIPGTVPIPRHWGRKRKYLQGKRGIEKLPFQLPDFIIKTGITQLRDAVAEDESKQSAKQRNRSRVAPKSGAIDVDYRTLHDAFFKYQTKPTSLTGFGDLYYEGKEFETRTDLKPGGELSSTLREALGMTSESSPTPWLINIQRYGPPPSYPNLNIPGLNTPLPNEKCQYGYHVGGWGKPPIDAFGRPLYGGNPFGKPGGGDEDDPFQDGGLVTSDGKTIAKASWGSLPTGNYERIDDDEDGESSEEEESSDEEMESEGEEQVEEADKKEVPTAPASAMAPPAAGLDLRKQAGDETPFDDGPKQLYTVLEQTQASKEEQQGSVFSSDVAYVVPGAVTAPEGAESVLSKVGPSSDSAKRKRQQEEDDDGDLRKKFKF